MNVNMQQEQKSSALTEAPIAKKVPVRGVLTLIGGVSLMLYLGCFFLWGNISIYVLSYFHKYQPEASYDFIFLVDSILVLFNWIGYQLGTYLN